jgi:cysteine desulfurase/selenocysteine lyase
MQEWIVIFMFFQATKCGPTGIGILYGKEAWLNKLPPSSSMK